MDSYLSTRPPVALIERAGDLGDCQAIKALWGVWLSSDIKRNAGVGLTVDALRFGVTALGLPSGRVGLPLS